MGCDCLGRGAFDVLWLAQTTEGQAWKAKGNHKGKRTQIKGSKVPKNKKPQRSFSIEDDKLKHLSQGSEAKVR